MLPVTASSGLTFAAVADPLRIMMCGDSMTAGNGVGAADPATATAYREAFYQRLREHRGNLRLLGTSMTGRQTGGGCLLGDWHYVGAGGKRIDEIDALATTARAASGAVDLYVLEGGFNDLSARIVAGDTAAQASVVALAHIATSIANRRAADPAAWIFVCDLGPVVTGAANAVAMEAARLLYNAGLPAVIAAAGALVEVVPTFSLLTPALVGADFVHPLGDGYSIVGAALAARAKKRFPWAVGRTLPRLPVRRSPQPTLTLNGGTDNVSIPTSAAVSPTGFASFTIGIKVRSRTAPRGISR